MPVSFLLGSFCVLYMHAMACVMASIIYYGSICMLAAFKSFISFFCHSITSVWALIFAFFLFLQTWLANLTSQSALFEYLLTTLVDTVAFAAFVDLVPKIDIHSVWNFANIVSGGDSFNKLWTMAAKYWPHSRWANWVFSTSFTCDFYSGQTLMTFLARTCNSSANWSSISGT